MKIDFEDEFLCVVEKPSGLVVNVADSVKSQTLQEWFTDRYHITQSSESGLRLSDDETEFYQKGGVVHRLDKDTSGLIILAKKPESYVYLKKQFVERTVKKTYYALVHGLMSESSGVISLPVERHSKNKHKFAIGTDYSRTAVTEYDLIETYQGFDKQFGLYKLRLHTGRTHQIRVHMKHFQHPLVSDSIYGGKAYKSDLVWCPRLFLHACEIEFLHPNGIRVNVSSELPADLQEVLEKLMVFKAENT